MKSRTKLFVAIAAFLIAFGAAVGVTVGVLAARQISVTTPIDVTYTSEMVAARLSATYQRTGADADPVNFLVDNSDPESTTITFNGEEDSQHNTKGFAQPSIPALTAEHKTIVFTFTIINDTNAAIVATISYPTPTNMTVTRTGDANTLNIAANQTGTYTLTLTITNVASDASFSGNISWSLERAA